LIELIVVMVLIALLLTIAVPRYFQLIDSGKLKVQKQNMAVLRDAIDKYYGDFGRYPDALDDLVTKRYLREVPMDPVSESSRWVVLPPPAEQAGNVYDVRPQGQGDAALPGGGAGSPPAPPTLPGAPPLPR
jgi:general secretion pathway protein G